MQLSRHFSLAEFTRSNTALRLGLSNEPHNAVVLTALANTARQMERVRGMMGGGPVHIFSVYRSPALNKAVGGATTSSHLDGEAVDFEVPPHDIANTVAIIRASDLKFDQLIDEFSQWVHIGFGSRMREQVLKARKINGRTVYSPV